MIERMILMSWDYFWSSVFDNMGVPILALFGGAIVVLLQKFGNKITKSIDAKNEIASLNKQSATRIQLLSELKVFVEAAVASNMQLAEKMKAAQGGQLTDEQGAELQAAAKELVYKVLPPSLTEDDGVLLEVIGGRGRLDAIIDNLIEQYVYEYKTPSDKKKQNNTNTSLKKKK